MDISVLRGKTILAIEEVKGNNRWDEDLTLELIITCSDCTKYKMYNPEDGPTLIYLESIVGELDDLIGNPILVAEESNDGNSITEDEPDEDDHSYTWTFYKLATIKGYVDLRWYGSSNGYYSETVDIKEI